MQKPAIDVPIAAPRSGAAVTVSHVRAEITPNDERALAFRITLPKTWALSKAFGPVPAGLLTARTLCSFHGASDASGPLVAVTVTEIPFEVRVHEWAQLALTGAGWSIISGRWLPGLSGPFYDVMAERRGDGRHALRRSSVRADGGRVFSVDAYCELEQWQELKETFWIAHAGFELVAPTRQSRMEPWLRAHVADPHLSFAHPRSWSSAPIRPAPRGMSAVDLNLFDARGAQCSYLQVSAARRDGAARGTLAELTLAARMRLADSGIEVVGPSELIARDLDDDAFDIEGYVGSAIVPARRDGATLEVHFGFIDRSGLDVSVLLVNPAREQWPLFGLRGRAAFDIVRRTLQAKA